MRLKILATGLIFALLLMTTPSNAFRSEAPPIFISDDVIIKEQNLVYRSPTTILPGGSLTIIESTVDFQILRPCTPVVRTPAGCNPDILVLPGGSLTIIESRILVSNDLGLGGTLISGLGGTIIVRESHISGINGITVQEHGRLEFSENEVHDWVGRLGFWRDTTGFATQNHFHNQSRAIDVRDASPLIDGNRFDNLGRGVLVEQSVTGDKVHSVAPHITQNQFTNSYFGVISNSGMGALVDFNHFENLVEAVVIAIPTHPAFVNYDEPSAVTHNTFRSNTIDLNITSLPSPAPRPGLTADARSNVFEDSCRNIVAWGGDGAPFRVDARSSTFASLRSGLHCVSLKGDNAVIHT